MKVQGKSTGKRNSKGRIVEVGKILVCLKHSEEASVAGVESVRTEESADEVRKLVGGQEVVPYGR